MDKATRGLPLPPSVTTPDDIHLKIHELNSIKTSDPKWEAKARELGFLPEKTISIAKSQKTPRVIDVEPILKDYEALTIDQLAAKFDLPRSRIMQIIRKARNCGRTFTMKRTGRGPEHG